MKNFIKVIGLTVFMFGINLNVFAQDVPASVKNYTSKLKSWASSPAVIAAVKEQNGKNVSLDKIKELDKKWSATSGLDDFMKTILANDCSEYLKKIRKENAAVVEAFAMDNKGANVGMTNKTSDYWQGDEDKFVKSYNNGNGSVHYGKLSFDESSQTYVIQVSVPVVAGGKTIGAVTFGIDPAKIK